MVYIKNIQLLSKTSKISENENIKLLSKMSPKMLYNIFTRQKYRIIVQAVVQNAYTKNIKPLSKILPKMLPKIFTGKNTELFHKMFTHKKYRIIV